MNLIKRHKGLAIVGGLTLILIVVMLAIFARMIFSTGESEYGHRLDGLVEVDKNDTKEIIEQTKQNDAVEDIDIRTQGKIIYITIEFKEGTNLNKAKEIADNALSKYDENVVDYYDFGFFLKENITKTEDEEKQGFIVAGTKHPSTEKISWTKD